MTGERAEWPDNGDGNGDGAARAGAGVLPDQGSTIPLILGFFLIAFMMVAGSIALGEAFVQQRDLQDTCDGAATAAAASAANLDRSVTAQTSDNESLPFVDVRGVVDAYLQRDPDRHDVQIRARLSPDRERITLTCTRTTSLALGGFFGRGHVRHTTTSSARATVIG